MAPADIDFARAKLRRRAIRQALYSVWPKPLGAGLIGDTLPADIAAGADELERALYYLCDRGTIARAGSAANGGPALYRLTVEGVDKVESDPAHPVDQARAARMLRLRVLQALSWGGPAPMGVSLISVALAEDTDLDLSEPSIRRALRYLVDRRLVVEDADAGLYRIAADGTDYLAGDGDGIAGVARPTGW
jgi:ABC-type transport system substrate-binding protein